MTVISESKTLFQAETQQLCHYRAKLCMFFGITLVPIFSGLDYVVAPLHGAYFLSIRLVNTLESLLIFFLFLIFKKLSLRKINLLTSLYFSSIGVMIAYMCRILGGYESSYYVGLCIVLMVMGLVMPWPTIYTIMNSLFVYVAYLLFAYTPQFSVQYLINNSYFLLSMALVAVLSTYWSGRLRLKEFLGRQDLKDANERLQSLDRAKTRFFSNVTHEFRTPLVALSSTIQMILDQGLTDPKLQKQLLMSGKHSLDDMLENVNDLLTKTRSEKGMIDMRWSEIDIVRFVEQIVKGFEPIARQRGNELVFKNHLNNSPYPPLNLRAGTEGGVTIYADRTKLKKIVNNLLGNAMKFTKNGRIEIILENTDTHCIVKVRDTGQGIPQEDFPTLFDPFTQASNNLLREVQGTGLGLAMVRDFVEQHRGTVSVESELGKGSTFTVKFLLGDAHVDQNKLDTSTLVEDEEKIERVNLGIKSFDEVDFGLFAQHDPNKARILLVEDNPQVLQVLAHLLKDHYNLSFARDGKEGLSKIEQLKPDLVVSDIMMPRMNGYELVHAIKAHPELKMIPVILLTSKADTESKIKGFEEGADEYLSKPFNNQEVLTRVKGLIERRKIEMEFIHAEKMISLGQLVAGVAHEINNPISYAKSAAASLDDIFQAVQTKKISLEDGMRRMEKSIAHVKDGTERVRHISAALQGFVRQGAKGFHPNDIHPGLESTLSLVHTNHRAAIQIHKSYELTEPVVCNINQLNQVFLNLLNNAMQALDDTANAALWIETRRQNGNAIIRIRDNGPGIPEELRSKIFNPFFTTKDVGKGTGLGLYISQQIVYEHGGSLALDSSIGEGTRFTIELPIQGRNRADERSSFTTGSIDRGMEDIQYPHRG